MKALFPLVAALVVTCGAFIDNCLREIDADFIKIAENKHVKLIKFSDEQISKFDTSLNLQSEKDYSKGISSKFEIDLGMNDVPVLDQGLYGTCVTFSTTAALNAILGEGDFISQQCSLELDYGLGQDYWDGAYYPSQILKPLKQYGVVKQNVCDNHYPVPHVSLSVDNYKKLVDKGASEKIAQIDYSYNNKSSVDIVKAALKNGHRVLVGFQLQKNSLATRGFDLIVDDEKKKGGLWACKQGKSANFCSNPQAGHEVLIIGYDDEQELLKIRNSWSDTMGDSGNYYMSYAYFSKMVLDTTEVWEGEPKH